MSQQEMTAMTLEDVREYRDYLISQGDPLMEHREIGERERLMVRTLLKNPDGMCASVFQWTWQLGQRTARVKQFFTYFSLLRKGFLIERTRNYQCTVSCGRNWVDSCGKITNRYRMIPPYLSTKAQKSIR